MGYYVIKFISEPYTLQEETVCNRKISIVGELVVKAQYMNYMQDNKKIYWGGKTQQKNIIGPSCTIVHPRLDVTTVAEVNINKNCFQ